MRALGVDFGEKRIGLAVSDPGGTVVVPVGAIERTTDARAAAALRDAAREREVERIVLGLPRLPDGTEGEMALRVRKFAERLRAASGLPVDLADEALTSVAADEALREAGGRRSRRPPGSRDAEAAAAILRDYLSRRASRGGPG